MHVCPCAGCSEHRCCWHIICRCWRRCCFRCWCRCWCRCWHRCCWHRCWCWCWHRCWCWCWSRCCRAARRRFTMYMVLCFKTTNTSKSWRCCRTARTAPSGEGRSRSVAPDDGKISPLCRSACSDGSGPRRQSWVYLLVLKWYAIKKINNIFISNLFKFFLIYYIIYV